MVAASGSGGGIAWADGNALCFYWGSGYTGSHNDHTLLNYVCKTYGFYYV